MPRGFWAQALMPLGPKQTYADFVGRDDTDVPTASVFGNKGANADNATA